MPEFLTEFIQDLNNRSSQILENFEDKINLPKFINTITFLSV
jgi:hypothetical protein